MPRVKEEYSFLDEWKSLWKPDMDALGGYNGATSDPTRIDPKVVEWAKHNCSHKPHFIKIINHNAANGGPGHMYGSKCARKLTVPKPFVRNHFRDLKRVVTLENEEGKKWKVSFGEIRSHPSWQQGWRRLAIDHDLQPGDVIVFVLMGDSHFRFTRFDEDGNILREKSTRDIAPVKKNYLFTTHSSKPSFVTNESHPRTSWQSQRAAAFASRYDHCKGDECGHDHGFGAPSQLLAPAHKKPTEAPCKSTKQRKMGEIMSKANSNNEPNLAISNQHPRDSGEAGSTSTADSPSTVTISLADVGEQQQQWEAPNFP